MTPKGSMAFSWRDQRSLVSTGEVLPCKLQQANACLAGQAWTSLAFVVNVHDPSYFDLDLASLNPGGDGILYTYHDVVLDPLKGEIIAQAQGLCHRCHLKGIDLWPHMDTRELYHSLLGLIDLSEGWMEVVDLEMGIEGPEVSLRDPRSGVDLCTFIRSNFPHFLRT